MDWRRFHTPYIAGGLRDQPLLLFSRLRYALNIFDAIMAWKTKYTPNDKAYKAWLAGHEGALKVMNYIWLNQLDQSIDGR